VKTTLITESRVNLKTIKKKAKIEEEKTRARDQRGKKDNERSTWWMENEEQNSKMLQWIDK